MKIISCNQGSPEWHAARLGKVTASRIADLTAKTKSGWSTSRANYAAELIAERLTKTASEHYISPAMAWGTEQESSARSLYEFMTDNFISEVGFVQHPTIDMAGASPDGLAGDDGLIEIKCPLTATHIATLRGAPIDGKYVKQMMWQMACTGRAWCDFISFDPRLPAEMQLHITRVARDAQLIAELEAEVVAFLGEVSGTVSELTTLYPPIAEAAE